MKRKVFVYQKTQRFRRTSMEVFTCRLLVYINFPLGEYSETKYSLYLMLNPLSKCRISTAFYCVLYITSRRTKSRPTNQSKLVIHHLCNPANRASRFMPKVLRFLSNRAPSSQKPCPPQQEGHTTRIDILINEHLQRAAMCKMRGDASEAFSSFPPALLLSFLTFCPCFSPNHNCSLLV